MKKGLGSIPKGLAWINKKKEPAALSVQKIKKNVLKKTVSNSSQQGLIQGWTRATFIIKQEHCKKLKALSYWDRITVKDLVEQALEKFLKNKRIKSVPQRNR